MVGLVWSLVGSGSEVGARFILFAFSLFALFKNTFTVLAMVLAIILRQKAYLISQFCALSLTWLSLCGGLFYLTRISTFGYPIFFFRANQAFPIFLGFYAIVLSRFNFGYLLSARMHESAKNSASAHFWWCSKRGFNIWESTIPCIYSNYTVCIRLGQFVSKIWNWEIYSLW